MPSSVPPPPARPKYRAFPVAGSVVRRVTGTVPGSDSLCPAPDFGFHLIRRLAVTNPTWLRRAGGPPLLTRPPSVRATTHTPGSALRAPSPHAALMASPNLPRLATPISLLSMRQSSLDAAARTVATSFKRREHDASTPGSLPTPAICYGASWPLPRRISHPLVIGPFAGHTWGAKVCALGGSRWLRSRPCWC